MNGQVGLRWPWSSEHASSCLYPVSQAAIVVGCNFAAVMLVFPAILSLDLCRRHHQRLDVLCCFSRCCPWVPALFLPQPHPSYPHTPPPPRLAHDSSASL